MRRFVLILAGLSLPASALAAAGQQPIEPIDVPPSIEQGLDMVYIDREIAPSIEQRSEQQQAQGLEDFKAAPVDMFSPVHPLYTDLRRALVRYQMRWGSLPQVEVPAGPTLKLNTTGDRVALLRQRLGLPEHGVVHLGVLEPCSAEASGDLFSARCIELARMARRLQVDFELPLSGVALALAYRERVRQLEERVHRLECELPWHTRQ